MSKTILIVDDIKTNREILKNILGDEYLILEAADGREAVALMDNCYERISAVLLDLTMPVMDGFQVLEHMHGSRELSTLPVIVTTGQSEAESEVRALKLGANDYISKPYNSTIIKQRIRNAIRLWETAATVNSLRRDRLTGLHNREAFFDMARELVSSRAPGYYIMACFDVDSFKVVNDQYGTEKGDEALRHIARVFEEGFSRVGGICCRVTADNFAVLYPASLRDSGELSRMRDEASRIDGLVAPLSFSIGRYLVTDTEMPPSGMYDRASLAADSIKGRYDMQTALYDESMRERLLFEQQMVMEMAAALKERQFEVWFQPQYNHSTGALIGAEALARWRHPEKGLIPPSAFVPIFERNGFIYELDKFIWEETCRCLRKWTEQGLDPLPVSVNVSRYDVFRPDLEQVLTGLLEKYGVAVGQLRLEITESAFAESTAHIVAVVKRLVELGFTIEIDDFGSGYSSLNTLRNVPAQIVKLDMRFLDDDEGSQRGGNILESVIRMTKWLGMSVIAEGVEDRRQADFLKTIGCSYVQGFLYARPMDEAAYEQHCANTGKEERLLTIEAVENLDNSAFWDPRSMDTLIFNSYVGGACIFEYHKGEIELLRVNDKYASTFGSGISTDDVYKYDAAEYMDEENRGRLKKALDRAIATGREVSFETFTTGLYGLDTTIYIRSAVQLLARAGDRYLLYCTVANITARREAEKSVSRLVMQLQAVMDNVSCGITAAALHGDEAEYLLTNDRYYELLGYSRTEYKHELGSRGFDVIHPEDRDMVRTASENTAADGQQRSMEYRVIRRDGSVKWLRSTVSMASFEGLEGQVQLCTYTDVSAEKQAAQELLDNLPGGAGLFVLDGEALTVVHLNKRYWELVGREGTGFGDSYVLSSVHPDDRPIVTAELASAIFHGRTAVCDFRVRIGEDSYKPFHVTARITPREDGRFSVYAIFVPIADDAVSIQEMLPIALQAVMASSSDLSFVKDSSLHYICCSRAFARMVGLEDELQVIGKTDYDLFSKELADRYVSDDRTLMESRESIVDMVEALPDEDGQERFSSTSKYLLYDSMENVIGLYGVGRDITDARQMESQLQLLTNSIPGGIAIYIGSPDRLDEIKLSYFSDGFCRLFNYSRQEYQQRASKSAFGQVFTEDKPLIMAQIRRLLRDGTPVDCTYRAHINGGGYKWINLKAVMGGHRVGLSVNAVLFDVSQQQKALEQLRISEEVNRLAIAQSRNVVCRYSVADRTLLLSSAINPIFGVEGVIRNVPYGEVERGHISPETAEIYTEFFESIARGEKKGSALFQRSSSAGWRWLQAHFTTVFSGGEPVSAVLTYEDVTESVAKEEAYRKWQESMHYREPGSYSMFRCVVGGQSGFETVKGSLVIPDFKSGEKNFDARARDYALKSIVDEDIPRFLSVLSTSSLLTEYHDGTRTLTLEYRERREGPGVRWLRLTVELAERPHSKDVEAYLLFEDIDEARQAELWAMEHAEPDSLTGVMSRETFAVRAEQLLRGSMPSTRHALLLLDADDFGRVNEEYGRSVGDQAIIAMANSLRGSLRRGDLVGRLSGDRFLVLLTNISEDDAAAKARRLCAASRAGQVSRQSISLSIGIATSPADGKDFQTLYDRAEQALSGVKRSGKDNYAFYDRLAVATAREQNGADDETPKKRRMLIVDDSRIDHALLSGIFAKDFIVEKAKDGSSALMRLRHCGSDISVVLLDLNMPGLDGFAVLERMRQSEELRAIPVIVVTGDASAQTSQRAMDAGATGFVTKPVDPRLLQSRVREALERGGA